MGRTSDPTAPRGNHMTTRNTTNRAHKLGALLLVTISMVLTLTVFSTPEASAHTAEKFTHDAVTRLGGSCPDDFVPNGLSNEIFGTTYIGCTPEDDYVPVGDDEELCAEAGRTFITEGHCTFDRSRPCDTRPDFTTPISGGQCLRVVLVQAEFAHDDHGVARSVTPVCVETQLVQDNAAGQSVGAQFGIDGRDYLITTGGNCSFNCVQGWDINCDGKLGDFCPSEYDLTKVGEVGLCMADKGIAPTVN